MRRKDQKQLEGSFSGNLIRELIADITSTNNGHKLQNGEWRKNLIEPEWICPLKYETKYIEILKWNIFLQKK